MSDDLLTNQEEKRSEYLQRILDSDSPKKLIVSGPGTGKTTTFKRIFELSGSTNNLALTLIRRLRKDMEDDLGDLAEVKTFHAFCKRLLHEKRGGFELYPFLTEIIIEDSRFLGLHFIDFQNRFQLLDEESPQIDFYIHRGNYYNAVCFDDSVFRVLKIVQTEPEFIPSYDQIVIDEFQDFNPLEVAFINELQKSSPILIAGDDDQAVYSMRNSSPTYLRDKFHSDEYSVFELPFCSRCPKVVVEATTNFIQSEIDRGRFRSRIDRLFIPYLEGNEEVNSRYPKIVTAQISNIIGMTNFIKSAIESIPDEEISEANAEGDPCVLIIGKRQYLNPIYKKLSDEYSRIKYTYSSEYSYSLLEAYKILLHDPDSNLGWRIIASIELGEEELGDLLSRTQDITPIISLLPPKLIERHRSILSLLEYDSLNFQQNKFLEENLNNDYENIICHFFPEEIEEEPEPDLSTPSILLTSFEGCKGLSACHVFIVGLNRNIVPELNDEGRISDIEVSKFVVAMTRSRKLLYLLSNRYDYSPETGRHFESPFLKLIPEELKISREYIKSKDLPEFINQIFS